MKNYSILFFLCFLLGCAEGRLYVVGNQGEILGECSARFYWHWQGAQDSVDYMLYICAQEYLDKGYKLSDESILENDYTLPNPPLGSSWNKKIASEQFNLNRISEREYGYILAAIEYEYILKRRWAEEQLEKEIIDEAKYQQVLAEAKYEFYGK